ncbi:MAG: radical SAM protein [Anaerolineales bacterium]|nr:radical SAM protein [Anaerolineales bacterium]
MVTATQLLTSPQRLWGVIKQDVNALRGRFTAVETPAPGLYTYRITPNGRHVRIHLRIEPDGAGVLFIDVTDVIHLNPTAASMAKFALDDVPLATARARFLGTFQANRQQVEQELLGIYDMVDTLRHPDSDCMTCALGGLDRHPLFSTRARAPYKADLALTYGCNNECPHCYNEPDRFDMPSLPKEEWFKVLDTLSTVGVPHIIFTGGEATLHPDLPEIINYADTLGMVCGLNTNARKIAHTPYMETLAHSGLNHVQVTLASHEADVHNAMMGAKSFKQTVKGIKSALRTNVHVITNTTLMRGNMGRIEETIDFLYDLGIRTFAMNGMIYSGGGFADPNAIPEEEMPPLLVRIRDHAKDKGMRFLWYTPTEYCRMSPVELEIGAKRCNAGEYSICVEPNGDVLPCQSFYVSAGNITRDPWEKIWDGQLFRSFREREDDPKWAGLPEKCWECPDLPLCGGGCRIEREARDGVRTAEGEATTGGGCSGCSGHCGTGHQAAHQMGFIPTDSTTRTATRSTGAMKNAGFIGLDSISIN